MNQTQSTPWKNTTFRKYISIYLLLHIYINTVNILPFFSFFFFNFPNYQNSSQSNLGVGAEEELVERAVVLEFAAEVDGENIESNTSHLVVATTGASADCFCLRCCCWGGCCVGIEFLILITSSASTYFWTLRTCEKSLVFFHWGIITNTSWGLLNCRPAFSVEAWHRHRRWFRRAWEAGSSTARWDSRRHALPLCRLWPR